MTAPGAPGSLRRRLTLGALALVAAMLLATGLIDALVLRRFMRGQIDSRLDTEIAGVASALAPDAAGGVALTRDLAGPPFDRADSGWSWEVLSGGRPVAASPGGGGVIVPSPSDLDPPPPPGRPAAPRGAFGRAPDGEPLRIRLAEVRVGARDATVLAAAPQRALTGPLDEVLLTLGAALLAVGAGLVAAVGLQVRLGLRPLRRLEGSLAAVRSGRLERIPGAQPAEIAPLVAELNALLDQNDANLQRARRHVANLAHGLKTPLATLAVRLDAPGRADPGELRRLADLMDRRIRHHLGRARAAALGGPARARTPLGPRAEDLAAALAKVHADRRIACALAVPGGLVLGCDAQDVDEMLGNLMDNAFKWAGSRVRVAASAEDRNAVVTVEDDGPGLDAGAIPDALRPGRRLDEAAPGHGFGLPIARELAELYGGGLALGRSELGGLKVTLTLPLAEG